MLNWECGIMPRQTTGKRGLPLPRGPHFLGEKDNMAKPWIRLYTQLTESAKIQRLPDHLFRFLVNCWCLCGASDAEVLPSVQTIAWRLRVDEKLCEVYVEKLIEIGMLDRSDEGILTPHDWDEHQFMSDNSTERTRKCRENKMKRSGNVAKSSHVAAGSRHTERPPSVSVSVSEYVSESSFKEKKNVDFDFSDWFEAVYARHPKKRHKVLASQALSGLHASGNLDRPAFDAVHVAWCSAEAWLDKNGQYAPNLAEWVMDEGYKHMPPANGARKGIDWEEVAR